jgi:hypothetical protein
VWYVFSDVTDKFSVVILLFMINTAIISFGFHGPISGLLLCFHSTTHKSPFFCPVHLPLSSSCVSLGTGSGKANHSQGILFHWSAIAPGVLYSAVRTTLLAAGNIQANYQPWRGKRGPHAYSTLLHTLMQAQHRQSERTVTIKAAD